jgi:hypothetical protein
VKNFQNACGGTCNGGHSIFIGGFLAIVVLSMGLGAKNVVENLLAGHYVRQLFKQDQEVILMGGKGKIKQIHNLGIVMETDEGCTALALALAFGLVGKEIAADYLKKWLKEKKASAKK